MTKILVADDNSNIQRTVIQALAHLNTEVVAVNNGQAAVKKVAEISPDLVLADIFMPVRNGYEVCEYVKKNPSTAHVPVILLAGAFDPLDEREAQRVGADGILKKPFVPPDPLVNMVQTLLDRLATLQGNRVPVSTGSSRAIAYSSAAPAESTSHEEAEELSPAAKSSQTAVAFSESEQPVAFSSLLEAPVAAAVESEAPSASREPNGQHASDTDRTHSFDTITFWQSQAAAQQPEAPAIDSQEEEHAEVPGTKEVAATETVPAPEADQQHALQPVEPLEFVREGSEPVPCSVVDEEPIVLDPSKYASLTVNAGPAPELAKNPLDWMASAPPPAQDRSPEAAVSETSATDASAKISHPADDFKAPEETHSLQPAQVKEAEPKPISARPEIWPSLDAADEVALRKSADAQHEDEQEIASVPIPMAVPVMKNPSPAEFALADGGLLKHDFAEAPQDNVLVATRKPAEEPVRSYSKVEFPTEPVPVETKPAPLARLEAPEHPVADVPVALSAPPAQDSSDISPKAGTTTEPSGAPDPALVEAVVQRVLDKMRPQVVDIVTKEILRPVVEAMVNKEIDKQ